MDGVLVAVLKGMTMKRAQILGYRGAVTEGTQVIEIWALIVSAATLVVVLIQEVRAHRMRPRAEWQLHTRDFPPGQYTSFITNNGDADAREVMILPRHGVETPDGEPGWLLADVAAGSHKSFKVRNPQKDAWVNITWKSTAAGRRSNSTWLPLFVESELAHVRFDQQLRPWYWSLRLRAKGIRATAPDGLLHDSLPGSVRAQKKLLDRAERKLQRLAKGSRRDRLLTWVKGRRDWFRRRSGSA